MQIVIDIPKYVYDIAKIHDTIVDADIDKVVTAIKKGIPLPKGHGNLKNVNDIDYVFEEIYQIIEEIDQVIEEIDQVIEEFYNIKEKNEKSNMDNRNMRDH